MDPVCLCKHEGSRHEMEPPYPCLECDCDGYEYGLQPHPTRSAMPRPTPPPAEAPCAGCAALREQVDEFRAALNRSEDRFQAALRALESLTPGGSEFVGDIEACVAHVRHRYRSQHETVLAFGRRAQAASAREARLRAALGPDQAWPVVDVLDNLAVAAAHLLVHHSCDWHGYERVQANIDRAQNYAAAIKAALAEARRGGEEG